MQGSESTKAVSSASNKFPSLAQSTVRRPTIGELTSYAWPIAIGHLIALGAFYPEFITWTNVTVLLATVLFFGQGINLGYHRLLTHRSLRVPKWLEYGYAVLAMCCAEETPAKWVSTHRRHHRFSDIPDKDPHSPLENFFWGHMGWLMFHRNGRPEMRVDDRYCGDILEDTFYRQLERKWWLGISIYFAHAALFFTGAILIALPFTASFGAAIVGGLGATMWGVFLRTVVVWHITWSVNSLGHRFGYRSYQTEEESRNNWLVAILASGEGWHNNHHHDQASASVQHRWYEFDLTYYNIKLLQWLGLADKIVRPRHIRHAERQKLMDQEERAA